MATIIKAGGQRGEERGAHPVAFNFSDMTEQANQYVAKIRKQAAEIVAQAHQEAAQVRAAAQEQGRQAALEAAEKTFQTRLQEQMKTVLPALLKAVEQFQQSRDAWVRSWETNVVHLAAAMAERIVRRELAASPRIALDLVREALQLSAGGGRLKLRLNPQDLAALRGEVENLAAAFGKLAPTDIIPSPEVSRGGCKVETEFGTIDHQIETQLKRIEEELT